MTDGALRKLEGDLFDICGRLKAIDDGYYVCYNVPLGRFEVHNGKQRGGTLALVVPYDALDERTVKLVRSTRAERAHAFFAEMERENARAQRTRRSQVLENAARQAEQALRGSAT